MNNSKIAWTIDDDSEMGYTIRLMLKAIGFEARSFLHPRKPVKMMMEGTTPDLMILDMNMPGVTGIDVLTFVRGQSHWNHIPIIMLSVETADVLVHQALELGADGYLFKPMTLDELTEAVNRSTKRRQNMR
jgi:two-component system chemotaxis response regulator CheY